MRPALVPETRELIVYVDGSSWVNELTVLREIIRARMESCGVRVSALVFKLSRKDMKPRARHLPLRTRSSPRLAQVCLEPSFPLPMLPQSMLVFPISRMKVFKERLNPRWARGFR